ncbi:cell division control protein [Plectosphaerella plurivora]|uniref:Cell division control protein n=1 Tax=Plectosphaerella plurivora TaxID=936078 RepID=A0A9P9AC74_9PEZI|nr:cell division control protein [Plectosphaerella plurivora]
MAPPYSNGYSPNQAFAPRRRGNDFQSRALQLAQGFLRTIHSLWLRLPRKGGQGNMPNLGARATWQLRQNLTARRILSFPHLLVVLWMLFLLWGEYWIFSSKVDDCRWENWEKWPAGTNPHHLVLVADPQLIDPHSYPDRAWIVNELTVIITDNYLRKGYRELQQQLQPDSVFFLGDLFDGGREWKTAVGEFKDPTWAEGRRPKQERKLLDEWHRKYGENYWLREYARFGAMFIDTWLLGGGGAGAWQRGRKLVASLPGNHDLGFGDEVKVSVRDRFSAYFGDVNRVDVVGNHTIVSVDSVSMSAGSSDMVGRVDLKPIYQPTDEFLQGVKTTKRRAVERELRFWKGEPEELSQRHEVEDITKANVDNLPSLKSDDTKIADFPTILLTHVPLYRAPGTPCGPKREHWPPLPRPAGQKEPVIPDHRNAISVSKGYQYQNVLSEDDSVKLVKSIGNVKHVFSGDDHDYCEVVHSDSKENVREITVKSMSMAMGVPTPGFVMVSLYNPVDEHGQPLPGAPAQTMQTHLCLLPNQLGTFIKYAAFIVVCIAAIVLRAVLMPILGLTPFTLSADPTAAPLTSLLPSYKDKKDEEGGSVHYPPSSASSGSSKHLGSRLSSSRARSGSLSVDDGGPPPRTPSHGRKSRHGGKWGWGDNRGPRIDIYRDDGLYDGGKSRSVWRSSGRARSGSLSLILREILACTWRVVWMVVLFFVYLARSG